MCYVRGCSQGKFIIKNYKVKCFMLKVTIQSAITLGVECCTQSACPLALDKCG